MSGSFGSGSHRPGVVWLQDLKKAQVAEASNGNKPKITIQDLLERINDPTAPETQLIPSSPRSVQACFTLGIDPVDLQYHPPPWYKRKEDADDDVSNLRYERNEAVRQERLKMLMDTRKQLIDEGWAPPGETSTGTRPGSTVRREDSKVGTSSAMVEKERQRLEVLKRRQEKELAQMVAHEQARQELLDKQQKKVDELEARAAELARQKQEQEMARMAKQRDIELQKAREEKESERKARVLAEARYQHEKKMKAEKDRQEREIKKKAYQEELERRRKADEARRETEAILAAQAEEVQRRKQEMERRDAERLKRMAQETRERQAANEIKRKEADARISSALQSNAELMQRKRSAYEQKEYEAAMRRKELDELQAKEDARKRDEELRKEEERQDKYNAAMSQEEMRKSRIRQKADDKDQALNVLYTTRKKEHDLKKVEQEFQLKLRLDKVDAIQKIKLYQRHQLLERILDDDERTRRIMKERQSLQNQRKMANMHASMTRQAMSSAMDTMRMNKSLGSSSLYDILSRSRPATAF